MFGFRIELGLMKYVMYVKWNSYYRNSVQAAIVDTLTPFFWEDFLHMHVPQGQLWLFKPVHPGWEAHIPAYPKDKADFLSRSSPGRKHMFFLPHWQTCSFSGRARVNFRNMSSGKLWNMFKTMCSEMKNRIVEIMFNNIFNVETYKFINI